jgi:hypothetical protein
MHPGNAEWVDVSPGDAATGIDFELQPRSEEDPRVGEIVGSVFRHDPNVRCDSGERCLVPAVGALVRVTPAFPTFAPFERMARVAPDGSFRVTGLMTDADGMLSYYVVAELEGYQPAFYPGGVPFPDAQPLPVFPDHPADAGRIVLGGQPAPYQGTLAGMVQDPDGNPIEHAQVRIHPDPEIARSRVFTTHTDAGGFFRFGGLPAGVGVLVAASAEGYVPAYYPEVHRWREADRVPTGSPTSRVAPLTLVLRPNLDDGPHLQVGRVRAELETSEDDALGLGGLAALHTLYHRQNLPGAFFYLVPNLPTFGADGSPLPPPPASGAATTTNGTALITDLPEGTYFAFADRPGFETAWFTTGDGAVAPIRLDAGTPAVLADIRLRPEGETPGDQTFEAPSMLNNIANAPNPLSPHTTIRFDLMEPATVTVQVFDYRGRLVRSLMERESALPGRLEIPWDGTDTDGRRVSSGVYFYRIQAGTQSTSRKMVVLPQ